MKKFISALLSVLIILTMCPITVFASVIDGDISSSGSNDICEWKYDSTTKTMYINGDEINVNTAEKTNYLPTYKKAGSSYYYGYKGFENLVFGDKVKTVNEVLLNKSTYPNLKKVTFEGNNLLEIGSEVFKNSSVTDITLPESLTSIGNYAFSQSYITSIEIPHNVEYIGSFAFDGCSNLETVKFNDNILSSNVKYVFSSCNKLASVDLTNVKFLRQVTGSDNESVSSDFIVPFGTFKGCGNLQTVVLNNDTTEISESAFENCTSLVNINAENVLKIDNNAFCKDENLEEINLQSVESIGDDAFCNATALVKVVLPQDKYVTVGARAFKGDYRLSDVNLDKIYSVDEESFSLTAITSCTVQNIYLNSRRAFSAIYTLENLTVENLPSKVIPDGFLYASKVDNFTVNYAGDSSVSSSSDYITINDNAFSNAKIKNFNVPLDYVRLVRTSAFACAKIGNPISFSSKLAKIEDRAFDSFDGEVDILSGNISKIGSYAFANNNMESFEVYASNIANNAFYNCKNLKSFFVYSSNTSFGKSAFENCTSLKNFYIEGSVSSVGIRCFANTALTSFDLSETKSIENLAFENCANLETVTGQPTYIGEESFKDCISLKNIDLSETTAISLNAFLNCKNLDIGSLDSIVSIGKNAFKNCQSLTDINTGYYLKSVGDGAFSDCSNLEKVRFGMSLADLGNEVFENCPNLIDLTVLSFKCDIDETSYASDLDQLNDDLIVHCGADTKVCQFNENNGITCDHIALSFDNMPDKWHGTVGDAQWAFDDTTLIILGDNNVGNEFINAKGEKINLQEILNNSNCSSIQFLGEVNNIPDNFLKNVDCRNLTEINIPSTVTRIGENAFLNLKRAPEISIPSSVKFIGNNAFKNSSVQSIDLSNLTDVEIGNFAFCNNSKLTEVIMPQSVKRVGYRAFTNTAVTDIDLSNLNSDAFDEGVFLNCTGLTNVKIGENFTDIPNEFFDSTNISEFDFSNIKSVGHRAFRNTKLTTVTFGKNLEKIGAGAFTNCLSLTDMYVNSNATLFYASINSPNNSVGFDLNGNKIEGFTIHTYPEYNAFGYAISAKLNYSVEGSEATETGYATTELGQITDDVYSLARWMYYEDKKTLLIVSQTSFGGKFYDKNLNEKSFDGYDIETVKILGNCVTLYTGLGFVNPKHIILPDTLNYINYNAFNGCTNLESIIIPDSVLSLGGSCFSNCTSLKSVTLSSSMKTVPTKAFYNCTSLQYIDFKNVSKIDNLAFYGCSKIVELNIGDNVSSIGAAAFADCYSIVKINFGKKVTDIATNAFKNLVFCDTVNINSDFVSIGTNAFLNLGYSTTGTTVTLSDEVKSIDLSEFSDSNVSRIKVGKAFVGISRFGKVPALNEIVVTTENDNGYYSYEGCLYNGTTLVLAPQNVTTLKIKDGTTAIADHAVQYSDISIARIPDGVKTIGNYAFSDSSSIKAVRLPSTLEEIGSYAFSSCMKLKTVNIPEPCKKLGYRCFYNCQSLASVLLPEGLETIGIDSFNNCKSLVNVVVPQSVKLIDAGAFANIPGLKTVYIWNSELGINVFYNSANVTVATLVGSEAYAYANVNKLNVKGYNDAEPFAEDCFAAIDSLEGYLGYCTDGHGDIEWLTVSEADCENEGYRIGVCEYCSVILQEEHIAAEGHKYTEIAYMKETSTQRGIRIQKCTTCGNELLVYIDPISDKEPEVGVYNVSGVVNAELNRNQYYGENVGVENAEIVIDGYTMARTDENGKFSFDMKSGTYVMTVKYPYGFDRNVTLRITDHDIVIDEPIGIVACDFNKDGVIDASDQNLFRIIVSSHKGDPAYLSYVDLNHDGYINAKDYIIIQSFLGKSEKNYIYKQFTIE